jgi:hypothetical protein
MSSSTKMIRLQFEVSPSLAKEIEAFENEAEIGSHREFYANLISLWRWSAQRVREGKTLAAIDPVNSTFNELTLPSLDTIKHKALAERALARAGIPKSTTEISENGALTPQKI